MPDYEFHCDACGADFHREMTIAARTDAHIVCPACSSGAVQQIFRSVHINTRKAACDREGGCGCGGHCCHEC